MQLIPISPEKREIIGQMQIYLEVIDLQRVGQQLQRFGNESIELHLRSLRWVLARQCQEVLHNAHAALGSLGYFLGMFCQRPTGTFFTEEVGFYDDDC